MTPPKAWHPGEAQVQDYVDGGLPGLSAASVEAHLLSCADCRVLVASGVEAARLARVKDTLDDRLDMASRPVLERLLTRFRVEEADARALLAAPTVRGAWLLALLGAAGLGVLVAANTREANGLFLLAAPLVPLAATALAYAPSLDAAFPVVSATPYSVARLLLARSLAVGATALVGVGAASLALPGSRTTEVVWFLPAIALTALVLVLSPRLGVGPAAYGTGLGWTLLVGGLHQRGVDTDWVASGGTQVFAALVVAGAVLALARQWRGLELRGVA